MVLGLPIGRVVEGSAYGIYGWRTTFLPSAWKALMTLLCLIEGLCEIAEQASGSLKKVYLCYSDARR